MSQENVELMYRAFDAFNRRGLDAFVALMDDDVDTPLDEKVCHVARWRHGKCVWWRSFNTRAEALEAVGLSEQDAHVDS
jgi:ketosteroid isomerase-like protein